MHQTPVFVSLFRGDHGNCVNPKCSPEPEPRFTDQEIDNMLATERSKRQELVLAYEHPGLIERLEEKLHVSHDEAKALFTETKKFLYLCGVTEDKGLVPATMIDECWHHFILFLRDYEVFCRTFFGRLIYHQPFTRADRQTGVEKASAYFHTIMIAQQMFGADLSPYWKMEENWAETPCGDNCKCSEPGGRHGIADSDAAPACIVP